MKLRVIGTVLALLAMLVGTAHASDTAPKPAKDMIDAALASSARQHKPVFLLFVQSKCKWCKRLEDFVTQSKFKKTFSDNYVVLTLDVLEGGSAIAAHENAGGREFMAKLGGAKEVPFFAWIDSKGKLIANSVAMPGGVNMGYPALPNQIDVFTGLIKKTAPKWPAADLKSVHDYLTANAPKL